MESKKGSLVVMFLLIVSAFSATLSIIPESAVATTLYVGGAGPGNYTTIQSAIDAANVDDTVFVYNGTYVESITVSRSLNLLGEHRNTTVIDGAGNSVVVMVETFDLTMSGFSVTNASNTGILMRDSWICTISNNNISNNRGFGLFLARSPFNIITNNIISKNDDDGVVVAMSPGNTIAKNNISGNYGGVTLYDDDGSIINGNNISNNVLNGIYAYNSINSTVSNNYLLNNNYWGTTFEYSSWIWVTDNYISNTKIGIYLFDSSWHFVRGNLMEESSIFLSGDEIEQWNTHTIDSSNMVNGKPVYFCKNTLGGTIPSGAGQVILANCHGVTVENQNVSNLYFGMLIGYSSGNTIINNTVLSSNRHGIYLQASGSNTIISNNVSDSGGAIFVDSSSSANTIVSNTASRSGHGVYLASSGNVVTGNTLNNNSNGVYLASSYGNTIMNNTIYSNLRGVVLRSSVGNKVYHNDIIGNGIQAEDDTSTDQWDNGYPSGGNYWSDYSGTDIHRGPRQDVLGSDGIGDTPYYMWIRSQDRYPLVSPGTIYPAPPSNTGSTLSGSDLENVTLSWDLSPDESKGLVKEYRILRGDAYNSTGSFYASIGSVPDGMNSFVDALAGEGDSSTYFYMVCAVNATDNLTCADNQAGKVTRPLSKGPNLVSIPLIQSDENLQTVLQTVSYDNAWSYDPTNQGWNSLSKSKPYGQSLEYVNHTMALWVNVTQNSNLTVAGVVPTSTTIDLQAGWNLVGFPSFDDNYTVTDLKAAVAVERIERFDGSASPYYLRVMADGDFLQAGFGYWVRVESPAIWTIENT
jgi:parallel beta-helix repeat protein